MGMFMTVLEYTKSYIYGKLQRVIDIIVGLLMWPMILILYTVLDCRPFLRMTMIRKLSYRQNSQ